MPGIGPVWGCTKMLGSWHQDGRKILAGPCQIGADDPAYGSMPGSSSNTGTGIFQTGAEQQAGVTTGCAPSHFSHCQLCSQTGANPSVKSFQSLNRSLNGLLQMWRCQIYFGFKSDHDGVCSCLAVPNNRVPTSSEGEHSMWHLCSKVTACTRAAVISFYRYTEISVPLVGERCRAGTMEYI